LSGEWWKHIRLGHPNVTNLEYIEQTLVKPDKIVRDEEENVWLYYLYFKEIKSPNKFLRVVVKYLKGSGYVITSYFVRNIKEK
jgi:hypothetical protein